jgi:glycosyltransferase involved in cell wall biosynthesis
MKCSIITPTNLQNAFLLDLYDCIKNQSYTNWEWVIYLNGEASEVDLPPIIRFGDARIKIFRASNFSQSIGEIKKNAFMLGLGEILVEVDHDDMITPNCLEKLVSAFQDPSVGFAYSNSAVYHHQDSFQPYNPSIGWTYSKFNWKGKSLYAMNTFAPTSHSLQYIWYAPDHVRAWRTTLYLSLKGHNPDYSVCDDHELMIRTFLATKMVHIPEVLYIYRITGDNNWLQRSDLIQQVTVELGDKYI